MNPHPPVTRTRRSFQTERWSLAAGAETPASSAGAWEEAARQSTQGMIVFVRARCANCSALTMSELISVSDSACGFRPRSSSRVFLAL